MKLMKIDVYLCAQCMMNLHEAGKMHQEIWSQSCKVYCGGLWPLFPEADDRQQKIIEWLENKKYIITSEVKDELLIRPLGYYYLGNNRYGFCINMREHRTIFGAE